MPNARRDSYSAKCDQHYVIVATKPTEFPGAYASCVDEPEHLADWAIEYLREGATLQRVSCNRGHAMMLEYTTWCDVEDAKKATLERVVKTVAENRRKALATPLPRHECPGCFSFIYDLAAEQGWCCDCFPKRGMYERSDADQT